MLEDAMRMILLLSVGALLLGSLGLTAGSAHGEDPFAGATGHIMTGNYQAALEEYEAFLRKHPHDRLAAVAAMGSANIQYLALENLDAAIVAYDRVLTAYRESPEASEAARRKGECFAAREDWTAAGNAYREALDLAGQRRTGLGAGGTEPATGGGGETAAWINEVSLAAADCFYRTGDRQQVIATYEKVLAGSLPPEAEASTLMRLADCYETGDELERAAARYAELIENHPYSTELAGALAKRDLIAQHRDLNWSAYEAFAQANAANRQRAFAEAIEHCDRALSAGGSEALQSCARYRKTLCETVLAGDFTSGSRRLRELVASEPVARAMPNSERTLGFLERGATAEANVARNPDDPAALRALGTMYQQVAANAKAIEVLERAQALAPEDEQTRLSLGFAYAADGRNAEAAEAFEAYLQVNPNNTAVMNQIGYTYLALGNPEQAVSYFRLYAETAPEEANAHDSLGEGLLRAGRLDESAREYERATQLDPTFANSYFMLGEVYRQLGDSEKAIAALRRFLELVSSGPQADQARAALSELTAE
jgi:tetratricopeptide (TPR) repeat protein